MILVLAKKFLTLIVKFCGEEEEHDIERGIDDRILDGNIEIRVTDASINPCSSLFLVSMI